MAARKVIIVKTGQRSVSYVTGQAKSMAGYTYPLFGTRVRAEAKVYTERAALNLLNGWRESDLNECNKCQLIPA